MTNQLVLRNGIEPVFDSRIPEGCFGVKKDGVVFVYEVLLKKEECVYRGSFTETGDYSPNNWRHDKQADAEERTESPLRTHWVMSRDLEIPAVSSEWYELKSGAVMHVNDEVRLANGDWMTIAAGSYADGRTSVECYGSQYKIRRKRS